MGRAFTTELLTWSPDIKGTEADGRLYVCNHVSNEHIVYWDFARRESVAIALPEKFEGSIAICRHGTRFIVRKFERRSQHSFPTSTWIYVFDLQNESLIQKERFRILGSAYGLFAEEDGNHMQLCIQRDTNDKYGLRCLIDGTQQERITSPLEAEMYGQKISPSTKWTASGPQPVRISTSDIDKVVFPHFYAHSYVWSPNERYLAFFGRRWQKPPDYLWLYSLETDQVYRLAAGERFIPVYWA